MVVGLDARGDSVDAEGQIEGGKFLGGFQEAFLANGAEEGSVHRGVGGGIAEFARCYAVE